MSQNGTILLAGGSGFVGISLATHLAARGYSVAILSRHPPKVRGPWRHVAWDARGLGEWTDELDGAAGLVNLAGRSVDCVKTPDHQDEILRSRVEATRVLGIALRSVANPPPVWVQMSTAHIYGDPPEVTCTEDSAFGYGLAPTVGQAWENEFTAQTLPGQRSVILRTSFVIGRNRGAGHGALAKLRWLTRLGLGGKIGSGRQGISWIHEADLNRLFERALTDPSLEGPYIASAPEPVPQREFSRELRKASRRSHRASSDGMDGADRRPLVARHRSGTGAVRPICGLTPAAREPIRVQVPSNRPGVGGPVRRLNKKRIACV